MWAGVWKMVCMCAGVYESLVVICVCVEAGVHVFVCVWAGGLVNELYRKGCTVKDKQDEGSQLGVEKCVITVLSRKEVKSTEGYSDLRSVYKLEVYGRGHTR